MNMADQTRDNSRIGEADISRVVKRIVAECAPRRIILFGSHVYGNPSPDSDVDVLVIVGDDGPDRFELSRKGYAALRGIGIPVELHFCRASTFERFSPVVGSFYRDVKDRGRVVYAA